jgi:arabinofuranosyltransferase
MSKRTELLLLTLWVLAVAWIANVATGRHSVGIDDAQIFFTYAQNLASGKGLLYSPGVPRAEGYTSTLWMAISALMFWIRANEIGILAVELLLLLATQVLVMRIIDRLVPDTRSRQAKLIYIALLTASPGYVTWTTITLMDTGLWSTLLVALVFVLLFPPFTTKGWIGAGLIFALSPLARPEATLVAPVLLALLWLKLRGQQRSTAPVWWILATIATTALALTLFRYAYFGYPLPSTYYAKVSSSTWYNLKIGSSYLGGFVLGGNIALIATLACVFFGWHLLKRTANALLSRTWLAVANDMGNARQTLAIVCLFLLALPVLVGGDHFKLSRFYQPAWPMLCLVLTLCAVQILSSPRFARLRAREWAAPAAVACLAVLLSFTSYKDSWLRIARYGSPIEPEFSICADGKKNGEALDAVFADPTRPAPTIGVIAAGGIARTYRGPIIDLMGLNYAYIAHYPGDRVGVKDHAAFQKAAFYNIPVDILVSSPEYGWAEYLFKGLFHDPKFVSEWRYGVVYKTTAPSLQYTAFYSDKFIQSIRHRGDLEFRDTMVYSKSAGQWERVPVVLGQAVAAGQS